MRRDISFDKSMLDNTVLRSSQDSSGIGGMQGPGPTTANAIVTWLGIDGIHTKDNPNSILDNTGLHLLPGTGPIVRSLILSDQTNAFQISLHATNAMGASYGVAFPAVQGAAGTTLQNDGAGNLTWVANATAPAGVAGQVQFNNGGGAFGADASLFWDNATKTLRSSGANPFRLDAIAGQNLLIGTSTANDIVIGQNVTPIRITGSVIDIGAAGVVSPVRFFDLAANHCDVFAPNAIVASYSFILPTSQAVAAQVSALVNNGVGQTSWLGIQKLNAQALGAGTKTVNTLNITASSTIIATVNTPAGGAQGVKLAIPAASRTPGTPGSFIVNAVDAAGALVNTDTSTFDVLVIG
jgi:hypothetical protein